MQDYLFDAHLDLGWNALQWDRDLTQSAMTIRAQEAGLPGRGQNTVALPQMRTGRVALCIGTLMGRNTGIPVAGVDFRSPQQANGIARGQLAYYHALAATGEIRLIRNHVDLNLHLEGIPAEGATTVGLVIGMESADAILHPDDLQQWWDDGLRIIGPAHYGTGRYAGGTGVEDGLTAAGLVLLRAMEDTGMILDLTHLSDAAFWQALEQFDGTVIASHSNCRSLVPHQRQLDDRQIKAIAECGGVVGIAFDAWMLVPGFVKRHSSNTDVSLAHVVDHIDHICQLTGTHQFVGIGSDLDGGFGREQSPADLNTIADLQKLGPLLQQRGYDEAAIHAILHRNWIQILKKAWL
ncbi:MAG: membrane dipeptidase [Chloroflexota bacterium]